MEIILKRRLISVTSYQLCFWYPDQLRKWGFSFDCDADGNVDTSKQTPESIENLEACRQGHVGGRDVVPGGIEKREREWYEPAVGRCSCGKRVTLADPLDNVCACGACYNSSGQKVTPSRECDEQGNPNEYDV